MQIEDRPTIKNQTPENKLLGGFTVDRNALFSVLKRHAGVVENSHSIKALAGVRICLEDGSITMTVSNGDLEIVSRVPIADMTLGVGFELCLHFRKMYDICRLFSDDEPIRFSVLDNKWVTIKSGRADFKLALLDVATFPTMPTERAKHDLYLKVSDLSKLLDMTSFCMGVQDVRFYLNGLLFEVRNGQASAFSSDGHRLAIFELKREKMDTHDFSMLIPRRAVSEISKVSREGSHDAKCRLEVSAKYLVISFESCVMRIVLLQAPPLNYRSLLPKERSEAVSVSRQELLSSLSRCMILSHEKFSKVQLTVEKDAFSLMSRNLEHERISDNLGATYNGSSLTVSCNVYYLHEASAALDREDMDIYFFGLNHALCLEDEQDDYHVTYIIMPLSIDERCA